MPESPFSEHEEQLSRARTAWDALADSKSEHRLDAELMHLVDVVLERVDFALNCADPLLVPRSALKHLHSHLQQVGDALVAAATSGEPGSLEQHIDQVRLYLLSFPIDDREVDAKIAERSAQTANLLLEQLDGVVSATEERAHVALEEIKEQVAKVTAVAAEINESQQKAIDALIAKIEAEEARRATRIDEAISRLESQGSASEAERLKEWQAQLNEFKKRLDDTVSDAEKTFEAANTEYVNKAQTHVTEIQQAEKKASEILGLITQRGVMGRFAQTAAKEGRLAVFFNILTVVLLLVIGFGAWMTVDALSEEAIEWHSVLVRLSLTLVLALPAWFCQRIAADHRRYEKRNRTTALELASIDVFIETLPKEAQDDLKVELAKRIFGRGDDDTSARTVMPTLDRAHAIVEQALELSNKLAK